MSQIETNLREKLKDLADFHFLHSGTHSTKSYKLVNCNYTIRFSTEKEKFLGIVCFILKALSANKSTRVMEL